MIERKNLDPMESHHAHPDTRDSLHAALLQLVQEARHELAVVAPALDPGIWNSTAMGAALGRLATGHSRNRIRIVVEDSENLLAACARLVELARRVSDIVQIRRLGETHRGLNAVIAVADHNGCLLQPDAGVLNATLDLETPRQAAPQLLRFEEIWEAADPLPGLHGFRP